MAIPKLKMTDREYQKRSGITQSQGSNYGTGFNQPVGTFKQKNESARIPKLLNDEKTKAY